MEEQLYIRLLKDIKDEHLKKNDLVEIRYINCIEQIHVDWEKRSGLAIIPQIESYQILKPLNISLDYDDFFITTYDDLGVIIDLSDNNKIYIGKKVSKETDSDYYGEEFASENMIGYKIIDEDLNYEKENFVKTFEYDDKKFVIYEKPCIRVFEVCEENEL